MDSFTEPRTDTDCDTVEKQALLAIRTHHHAWEPSDEAAPTDGSDQAMYT